MAEEQYVQVRNLTGYAVVYNIPEDRVRRKFGAHETKNIAYSELQKLYYQPGGAKLIQDFLQIKDEKIANEFGVSSDLFKHEYSWTQEDVDKVLTEGSLDKLHDALDFAPEGIVDLIIERAIMLRIPDVNKRDLIYKCTGKNINQMIATAVQLEKELQTSTEEKPKQRRAESNASEEKATERRV